MQTSGTSKGTSGTSVDHGMTPRQREPREEILITGEHSIVEDEELSANRQVKPKNKVPGLSINKVTKLDQPQEIKLED